MKRHLYYIALALLGMGGPQTALACSTSTVQLGGATNVILLAGPYETCNWTDNNPNGTIALSVALFFVRGFGTSSAQASIEAIYPLTPNVYEKNSATCTANYPQFACQKSAVPTGSATPPKARSCRLENTSSGILVQATCTFDD